MFKLLTIYLVAFFVILIVTGNLHQTTCTTDTECTGVWGYYSKLINNLGV